MYKAIVFFIFIGLIWGCSKEGDEKDENPCAQPYINISVSNASMNFYVSGGSYGFLEIEYGANGFTRGSGTTQTVSSQHSIENLTNGTYDIYIRGNCGGTSWSDWSGPYSFLIQEGNSATCHAPYDMSRGQSQGAISFYWEHNTHSGSNPADYYEVEYGVTGFTIGDGTRVTVNGKSYNGGSFSGNTTYDYYVRANCGLNDWSPWSEPHSLFVENNVNMCLQPTNLTAYRSSSSVIQYSFNATGESSWEVTLLTNSFASPDSGNINPTNTTGGAYTSVGSSTRYFYARAVCRNGNRTPWAGPVVIN